LEKQRLIDMRILRLMQNDAYIRRNPDIAWRIYCPLGVLCFDKLHFSLAMKGEHEKR